MPNDPLDAFRSAIDRLKASPGIEQLEGRQRDREQFTKWEAKYAQRARAEAVSCSMCVWFLKPTDSPTGTGACKLVASTDQPDSGEISRHATCKLWNAGPARIRLHARIWGRGNTRGIAPGNLRYQLERVKGGTERSPPPERVEGRVIFPAGLVAAAREHHDTRALERALRNEEKQQEPQPIPPQPPETPKPTTSSKEPKKTEKKNGRYRITT